MRHKERKGRFEEYIRQERDATEARVDRLENLMAEMIKRQMERDRRYEEEARKEKEERAERDRRYEEEARKEKEERA
ncbi:hypothetical protein MBAV_001202, partial [Candidatus Magnetobacterium bavaricum]